MCKSASCLSCLCVCDKHHNQKQFGEEKVYFRSQFIAHPKEKLREGTQDRSLEAGIEAESLEEYRTPALGGHPAHVSTVSSPD